MGGWTLDSSGLFWHYTVATATLKYVRASCGLILRANDMRLPFNRVPAKARLCGECLMLAPQEVKGGS